MGTAPEDMSNIDSLPAKSPPQSPPPRPPGPTNTTDDTEMILNSRIEGKSLKVIPESQAAFIPARFPSDSEDVDDSDETDSISSQDVDSSGISDSDEDACNGTSEASDDEAFLRDMRQKASNVDTFPEKTTGSVEKRASVFCKTGGTGFPAVDDFSSRFHVCSRLDVSRPRSLGADAQSHQRAPSPSDAAMAKKDYSQKASEDTEHCIRKDAASVPLSQPQTSSRLAHPQGDDSFYGPMHSDGWNSPKGTGGVPPTPYDSDFFDAPPWGTGAAQSPLAPNNGTLPFGLLDAYGSQPAIGSNDAGKIFNPSFGRGVGLQAHAFWQPEYESSNPYWPQVAAPTSRYSYESNLPGNSQTTMDFLGTTEAKDGAPGKTSLVGQSERGQADRDAPQSKTSRLNISNLINEATINSPKISKKRKADDMSPDEGASWSPRLNESSNLTGFSDAASEHLPESDLPEAQIRETPGFPPATFASQVESVANGGNKTAASSSANSTHVSFDAPSQEPARKKVKVAPSSSRVGGMARFVSGVAVGVVGVLATIIATAPISVQEEALREMTRGA